MICGIKAAHSGTSILAKVPEGGILHLRAPRGGHVRPRQCLDLRHDLRRTAALRSLMGPSWCVFVSIASACRLLLPSSANTAGGGITPGNQVVCLRVVASSQPFKLRLHGSQPLCTSAAASQREPAMLPPSRRSSIHPRHRAASQSADLPPSVASGDCQSSTTFLAENRL